MIGQMVHHFSTLPLLFMAVIAVVILWFVLRNAGLISSQSVAKALPVDAKSGCKVSRRIEAFLLLVIAGLILVFTATNRSTNGMLLMLGDLDTKFAIVNIAIALIAAAALLLAATLCWFGKTNAGVIIAAVALCVYGYILNGPGDLLEALTGQKVPQRHVIWTINIGGCDVEGAELWVNGIKLGTLPYTTTPDEFKAKIPFWPEAPAEMQNDEDRWKMLHYSPWNAGGYDSSWRRWSEIVVPGEEAKYWGRHDDSEEDEKKRTYYAQVKYRGEWGYSRGNGSGGTGGSHFYYAHSTINKVRFPGREKRMEVLLDKARLADYKPTGNWYDAIETFGDDAVIAIRLLVAKEPQMEDLLAKWASRKYDLGKVTDEKSAWNAFEAICNYADIEQAYSTASIEGKAVEMLIPKLDPEMISARAVKIIRTANRYSWYHWKLAGKYHFGFSPRPQGLRTGSDRTTTGEWRGGGRNKLSMQAYPVAHAVWKMDEYLDAKKRVNQNVIEQTVVPEFLAQVYDDINRVKLANYIGSVELDKFLLRQNWQTNVDNLPFGKRARISGGGREVNGWLYLLSKLRSPAGDEFRRKNYSRIVQMADSSMNLADMDAADELGFLFSDLDKGKNSLAYKYWPRFSKLAKNRKHYEIGMKFNYLIKMEPISTVDMYVKTFQDFYGEHSDASTGFSILRKLPEYKKEKVCQALKTVLQDGSSNITEWSGSDKDGPRDYLLRKLDDIIPKRMLAEKILDDLHSANPKARPERVKAWLANAQPDHQLIVMLANDDEPGLRVLTLDAIKAHPTPKNRKMLEKFLKDEDAEVREAAKKVADELQELADSENDTLILSAGGSKGKGNLWVYSVWLMRFSAKRAAGEYFPKRIVDAVDVICKCGICLSFCC